MNARLVILAAAAVSALMLLTTPWTFNDDPAMVATIGDLDGQWVGRPAPDFVLPDVEGSERSLRDYRGKVVFLNFWATYCEPCKREMPSMERLIRNYSDKGLVMIAVSYDKQPAEVSAFMASFLPDADRSAMTLLMDPSKASGRSFGTELIPETYIIDRRGQVVARFVNAYDWTRPEVRTLIERLLRET